MQNKTLIVDNMKKISLFLFLIGSLSGAVHAQASVDPADLIVGIWYSDDNGYAYRWDFKDNGLVDHYSKNVIGNTFNYTFSATSPQCGHDVATGLNLSYLQLVDVENPSLELCYEITGLDEEKLVLIYIGGNRIQASVLKRHKPNVLKGN